MSNKRKFPPRFTAIFVCHYFKKPKLRILKPTPDFTDKVNDIIWRLEDLFFVKKKPYVNPVMTEAGKYVMDDIGQSGQSTFARKYTQYQHIKANVLVNQWLGKKSETVEWIFHLS